MREPKPITHVELSEKNKTLRLVAAILLLIIGAVGITVGIMRLLNKETIPGTQLQREIYSAVSFRR